MQRKVSLIFTWFILIYTCTHSPRINKVYCYISLWYGITSKFIPEASSQTSPDHMSDGKWHNGEQMRTATWVVRRHSVNTWDIFIFGFHSSHQARFPDQTAWTGYFPKWWNLSCTMFHTSVLNTFFFSEDPTPHSSNSSCLWVNRGCSDKVCIGLILLCFGNLPGLGDTSHLVCGKYDATRLLISNSM